MVKKQLVDQYHKSIRRNRILRILMASFLLLNLVLSGCAGTASVDRTVAQDEPTVQTAAKALFPAKDADEEPEMNPPPLTEETSSEERVVGKDAEEMFETSMVTQRRGKQDVRAIYLTSWSAGHNLDVYMDMLEQTSLNAVVIDIRESDGKVAYPTQVPVFRDNAGYRHLYDPEEVLARLHERDIYVIGRIVCFKDGLLPALRPEIAIKKKDGSPLVITEPNGHKVQWIHPGNEEGWGYLTALTEEALQFGFDEIQFDYVRFPETTLFRYDTGETGDLAAYEVIDRFLAHVRGTLPEAVLSADIFGVPLLMEEDLGDIGHQLEHIGRHVDFISPMIYPSHYCRYDTGNLYGNFWTAFHDHALTIKGEKLRKPDKAPYEIVYNSLVMARDRLEKMEGPPVGVRPYLQGFTMTAIPEDSRLTYGVEAFQAQIKAVEDAGYTSWIFWNAGNHYPGGAFVEE